MKWSDATYVEDQDQWWHGGITRSVFLYATGPVHLADIRADAGLADDLTTGTLELAVLVGFPGRELEPGWTVEARLEGRDEPLRAEARSIDPHSLEGWTLDDQKLMFRDAAGLPLSDAEAATWAAVYRRMAPPRDGLVTWRVEVPGVEPWSAERPALYRPVGRAARPRRRRRRAGRAPDRLPAGRDRRARPPGQRRAGVHPRRQPPRLRPAHRPDGRPATQIRGGPGADEAVRVQRGADLALPQRPGPPRR